MTQLQKSPSELWKYISFLLMGLILGYVIGRFELTTVTFKTTAEETQKQEDTTKPKEVATTKPTEPQGPVNVNIEGDKFLGQENAKVVFVDFSDFQCPFSKKFYTDIFPNLKKDYIDTGKIKYVYKDFPLNFHAQAFKAAMAAECAGEQNKYWEMHNKLYESQSEWSTSANPDETYLGYAKAISLDTTKFTSCVSSEKFKDEINGDRTDGVSATVKGTPTLFINGIATRGVPKNYDQFKTNIDSALTK